MREQRAEDSHHLVILVDPAASHWSITLSLLVLGVPMLLKVFHYLYFLANKGINAH